MTDELALFLLDLPMSVFLSNESLMNTTTIECFPPVLEMLQVEETLTKCLLLKGCQRIFNLILLQISATG